MKRTSTKKIEKLFEFKTEPTSEGRSYRVYDRFTASITDFGSGDIATAVEK